MAQDQDQRPAGLPDWAHPIEMGGEGKPPKPLAPVGRSPITTPGTSSEASTGSGGTGQGNQPGTGPAAAPGPSGGSTGGNPAPSQPAEAPNPHQHAIDALDHFKALPQPAPEQVQAEAAKKSAIATEPAAKPEPKSAEFQPDVSPSEAPNVSIAGAEEKPAGKLMDIPALDVKTPEISARPRDEAINIAAAEQAQPSPADIGRTKGQSFAMTTPQPLGFAPAPIVIAGPEPDETQELQTLLSILGNRKKKR